MDKGICLHIIKAAIIQKYRLPGMVSLDKFSIRRMRKKIVNEEMDNGSTTDFSEAENEANVNHQNKDETSIVENKEYEANVNHQNTDETSIVENKEYEAPKKRGRPAKVAKALEKEPETLKIRVNKSRKTPLVAVRKSDRLKIKK